MTYEEFALARKYTPNIFADVLMLDISALWYVIFPVCGLLYSIMNSAVD